MKNVKITSEGTNYKAIDLGSFDQLIDYSLINPKSNQEVKGKVFVGEILNSTCSQISFTLIPPHADVPFIHQHKHHEEIYVFLKGSGQYQVDGTILDISEGSVIRVAPDGKRTLRNNSDKPLIYMCIQCQAGSLDGFNVGDGIKNEGEISWK